MYIMYIPGKRVVKIFSNFIMTEECWETYERDLCLVKFSFIIQWKKEGGCMSKYFCAEICYI